MNCFAAQEFSATPTKVVETAIGVYTTCDAPVTELNSVGVTLSQQFGKQRRWLVIQLDKASALELAKDLLHAAQRIEDDAPAPDLKSHSWNLVENRPNY